MSKDITSFLLTADTLASLKLPGIVLAFAAQEAYQSTPHNGLIYVKAQQEAARAIKKAKKMAPQAQKEAAMPTRVKRIAVTRSNTDDSEAALAFPLVATALAQSTCTEIFLNGVGGTN